MTSWWNKRATIADDESLDSATAVSVDVTNFRSPTVLAHLKDLEGAADDTVTIRVVTGVGTYTIHKQTLAQNDTIVAVVPPGDSVEFESSNGVTYDAEVVSDWSGTIDKKTVTP